MNKQKDKIQKTTRTTNHSTHFILGGILILLSIAVGFMTWNILSGGDGKQQYIMQLDARLQKLEFCFSHNISPCSPEKINEWDATHEFREQFHPTVR